MKSLGKGLNVINPKNFYSLSSDWHRVSAEELLIQRLNQLKLLLSYITYMVSTKTEQINILFIVSWENIHTTFT